MMTGTVHESKAAWKLTLPRDLVNQLQHNEFAGGGMLGVISSAIDIRSTV